MKHTGSLLDRAQAVLRWLVRGPDDPHLREIVDEERARENCAPLSTVKRVPRQPGS